MTGYRSATLPPEVRSRMLPGINGLELIDDATTDQDLRVPPSNHFDKLRGNPEGFRCIGPHPSRYGRSRETACRLSSTAPAERSSSRAVVEPIGYMFRRYCPPTWNSAFVI